jgi:quercetin dioxygenase-like cupin family protein
MKTHDLNQLAKFAADKPVKKHFLNAKGFHAAIICLQKGVEIPPHPEDYGVFFTVINGAGLFTKSDEAVTLKINQGLYIKKDEVRGIKALEDLVVLGIQDRPKGLM